MTDESSHILRAYFDSDVSMYKDHHLWDYLSGVAAKYYANQSWEGWGCLQEIAITELVAYYGSPEPSRTA